MPGNIQTMTFWVILIIVLRTKETQLSPNTGVSQLGNAQLWDNPMPDTCGLTRWQLTPSSVD